MKTHNFKKKRQKTCLVKGIIQQECDSQIELQWNPTWCSSIQGLHLFNVQTVQSQVNNFCVNFPPLTISFNFVFKPTFYCKKSEMVAHTYHFTPISYTWRKTVETLTLKASIIIYTHTTAELLTTQRQALAWQSGCAQQD